MKKLLAIFTLLLALSISQTAYSQTLKEILQRKKLEAAEKAKARIEQKANEAIDKALEMPEKGGRKKKDKESKTPSSTSSSTPAAENESTNGVANDNGEFIIKTNIKCAAGKTLIEPLLQETDGVNSVSIDTGTGKLYLSAGGNTAVYNEVIEILRANGFEADGKKATQKNAPCK